MGQNTDEKRKRKKEKNPRKPKLRRSHAWRRRERKETVRPTVRPVPHRRRGRETQNRTQFVRDVGKEDRPSRRLQLHSRQYQERSDLGSGHAGCVLDKP